MLRTLRRTCCEEIEINIRPGGMYVDIGARVIAVNVLKRKCQCLVSGQLQFTLFLDHHSIYYIPLKTFGAVSGGIIQNLNILTFQFTRMPINKAN